MAFQEGEVVQLKSGGPSMTVEGYEDGLVICVWFEKTDRKTSAFKESTLKTYVRPQAVYVGRR
jgi:uncharacterized protein YodC (DUF2158 family)